MQSFTALMTLLTATSAFGLGQRLEDTTGLLTCTVSITSTISLHSESINHVQQFHTSHTVFPRIKAGPQIQAGGLT